MDRMSYRQLVWRLVHGPVALLTYLSVWLCGIATAQDIKDPIADYLSMRVPDRVQNTGGLWVIKKVEVDIQGDGNPDIFVGTWYRKSGPNTWLWVGYQKDGEGYRRITPAGSEVLIGFDNF